MAIGRAVLAVFFCSLCLHTQDKLALRLSLRHQSLESQRYLGPVHEVHEEKANINPRDGSLRVVPVFDETYDTHGYVTESVSYDRDGKVSRKLGWAYEYDGLGRILELRYYDGEGQLTNTGVYTYRDPGRTELVQINPGGSVNHKAIFLYDKAGNLVAESRTYPQYGSHYIISQYDKNGYLAERWYYDNESVLQQRSVLKHDKYGNTTESTVYKDGTPVDALNINRTVECDAKGNAIRFVNLNRNGSIRSTEAITYTFDDHGNWTRKTTTREQKGMVIDTEIIERTITYY